ncbi:helix-turn-helix transcriptional regulator [Ramlibacter tataouinensis]|uniref:Transcriptional regulator, XRE family-like protein n=1 Tax=Ramlibacter tataouinensis (strain ATCC BAA-407 / DSM 14655 / LMG 21543 / TTB310) TaxID=365046 RepID=F5Y6F6_RAMTT|nr:helix-turn-helix transcriptional regulator [Ramlibacter tataouinensis]AEG94030.1 transcriptional regulator, XRE family-like protein [Ramlibacter tataouinensis TTB310]
MLHSTSIVQQLESTRKAAQLTQAELAERSGVNRMTVGRVEAGLDPRLSTVEELARALGMEIILVPKALRPEVENFVRSGGKLVAQPPGVGAPKSIVDLLPVRAPRRG